MRRQIVAGNWKMNKTYPEALALVNELATDLQNNPVSNVEVIVAPPFPYLAALSDKKGDAIQLSAQNCHQKDSGAFTGEVSATMLASVGCEYVILGHSERRQYFQEDSMLLEQKLKAALAAGLKPIFCCGESLEQREQEIHFDFVAQQLKDGLFHLSNEEFDKVIIAYEPIWAIGTGRTASSEQAQEMHEFIREQVSRAYDAEAALKTPILYGGSCNAQNAKELFACKDVDGGLIGGAALKSADFLTIIRSFQQ
ncbi:triose-phosphate isomerase [Adhaeribacter sp. BT258]|uniref:Triosephosphate isomerase n=1 Tax=Adhaeribacter terrigena TaxID=2793070 RepID=A0ABS1C503_9BACT|nr:triose-phosphate isomerase [Adhaeribacter terrigena]MBK0404472.1 triose-phosphate isomerase [Adhaeribacter terrigena]